MGSYSSRGERPFGTGPTRRIVERVYQPFERRHRFARGGLRSLITALTVHLCERLQVVYLKALAEMYSQGGDEASQAAAREAMAALERLVHTLNDSPRRPCPEWPLAA